MKITVGTAADSVQALGDLSAVKLTAATSFKVARCLRAVQEPLKAFDEARTALLNEVGEPLENGKEGEFKINDRERWASEIGELLKVEIDIPTEKIKLAQFGTAEIEPRILFALEWLIEE